MIPPLIWEALRHGMEDAKLMLFMLSEPEEIITVQLSNSN